MPVALFTVRNLKILSGVAFCLAAKSRREMSSVDHFSRSAQQFDVELATGEQHIVQRFADIVGFDACAAISSDAGLRDASHQLFDERGADAFGPLRGLAHD